nr:reverse transcriptase domain-containing protein [Tanacetum cinerariifolium]
MGDKHLDTIPATKSDEFIKTGVENLIPIPSESEGIPEHVWDVPIHDNSPPLDVSKDQIEDLSESNEEFSSIDDDSFSIDKIYYVEASPPDSELISSEVMEIVISEVGGIDDDILLTINDDILREKLLNVNLLIAKIEALNANPTPSSDCKINGSATTHSDSSLYVSFIFDLLINPFPPADMSDFYEFTGELIPFISPPEYDCFLFKVEPNSRDFTKDVVEDISPKKNHQLVCNPSNPTPSTNPNPKGHNRRRSKQRIKEFNLDELYPPIVTMADQRTMAQFLQAPTKGYEDAIVVPAITADNFELKHGLLTLVQNKQFFGHDKEDPYAHVRYFNKITSTLNEAWDRFKDLLRSCPHHGFSKLYQLDTFYNALNSKDQDSLNYAVGGNFLNKMPRECLAIMESKSKVRYSHNKPVVAKVSTNNSASGISPDVAELKDMVKALLLDKKSQNKAPATVKAVKESCVTCGGAHSYRYCSATDGNVYRNNIQEFVSQTSAVNYN